MTSTKFITAMFSIAQISAALLSTSQIRRLKIRIRKMCSGLIKNSRSGGGQGGGGGGWDGPFPAASAALFFVYEKRSIFAVFWLVFCLFGILGGD